MEAAWRVTPIDTNIVVRLLIDDDRAQADRAQALIENNDVLLTTMVIVETEWVMRSAYRATPSVFVTAIEHLLGLPRVFAAEPEVVQLALSLHAQGFDFADAVHVAAAKGKGRFATFDKDLIKAARRHKLPVDVFEP